MAVNGVCLTATSTGRRRFRTQAMSETLERSTLGGVRRGETVNLELAARLQDRLGGHLVQGHVDAVARVARVERRADPAGWALGRRGGVRYLVEKGSVALDGVSLTIVDVGKTTFEVSHPQRSKRRLSEA